MRIDTIIDELICALKKDDFFNDKRIVYSYPAATKPTRISKSYIALGLGEINLESSELATSTRAGDVSINIDVFVPLKLSGEQASIIFNHICACLGGYNVLSIKAQRLEIDNDIQAYSLKTSITLGGEIDFGGGQNE